jgi:hypothetical protein
MSDSFTIQREGLWFKRHPWAGIHLPIETPDIRAIEILKLIGGNEMDILQYSGAPRIPKSSIGPEGTDKRNSKARHRCDRLRWFPEPYRATHLNGAKLRNFCENSRMSYGRSLRKSHARSLNEWRHSDRYFLDRDFSLSSDRMNFILFEFLFIKFLTTPHPLLWFRNFRRLSSWIQWTQHLRSLTVLYQVGRWTTGLNSFPRGVLMSFGWMSDVCRRS